MAGDTTDHLAWLAFEDKENDTDANLIAPVPTSALATAGRTHNQSIPVSIRSAESHEQSHPPTLYRPSNPPPSTSARNNPFTPILNTIIIPEPFWAQIASALQSLQEQAYHLSNAATHISSRAEEMALLAAVLKVNDEGQNVYCHILDIVEGSDDPNYWMVRQETEKHLKELMEWDCEVRERMGRRESELRRQIAYETDMDLEAENSEDVAVASESELEDDDEILGGEDVDTEVEYASVIAEAALSDIGSTGSWSSKRNLAGR